MELVRHDAHSHPRPRTSDHLKERVAVVEWGLPLQTEFVLTQGDREATMKLTILFAPAAAVLAIASLGATAYEGEPSGKPRQIIILKLDDVMANGRSPVSPRWQRIADFIEKANLKASFGIIGFSLEQDNQTYFDWIKNLDKKGNIEFWNHGYRNRKAEDKTGEFEGSFEEQKAALEKTQRLAREKLGIELRAFGPHWSGTNEDTAKALENFPEIKMCFYDPKGANQFVFERVLMLENPIFVPDSICSPQISSKNRFGSWGMKTVC